MNQLTEFLYQSETTSHVKITVGDYNAEGLEIRLPGSDAYFLYINCKRGVLACRLANLEVFEKLQLPITIFSAARLNDILIGKPVSLSQNAINMGAGMDMTGAQLIELFSSDVNEK